MGKRKSNFELLRIISMLMIVIFHCSVFSGFNFAPGFSANKNKLIVMCFFMLGQTGVNLFILISGYCMVNGHFKWKKLSRLLLQVQFYYWIGILISSKLNIYQLSGLKEIGTSFFPVLLNRYWFTTAYIVVYCLSPYLNIFIKTLDKKMYRHFLSTVLILFCVIPTFFGFLFGTSEAMLYYNRMIWFIIMYCVGAYIRIYMPKANIPEEQLRKNALRGIIVSAFIFVFSILLIDYFIDFFTKIGTTSIAYFAPPNTIPIVFLSISIFVWFANLHISYNAVINTVASTTLGVYLLHEHIWLGQWLWKILFHCADYQESPLLVARILTVSVIVFTVGMLLDLFRQVLEKIILKISEILIETKSQA